MRSQRARRQGAVITELAIVFPFLFFSTIFCIQTVQAFHLKAIADQAAWRALHKAATTPFKAEEREQWEESIRQEAIDELAQLRDFQPENLQLQLETIEENDRTNIRLGLHLKIASPLSLGPETMQLQRTLRIRQYR